VQQPGGLHRLAHREQVLAPGGERVELPGVELAVQDLAMNLTSLATPKYA
jgi:hypothetical protein